MIFGSLNEVFENDKTIYDAVRSHNQRMLNEDYSPKQNSTISNILKLMSRRGMDYEKLIQRNMRAYQQTRTCCGTETRISIP